ncbi:MBL fold metallo-hydrolase [Dyadobacter luteus]|uniref:MBL fold metallo-hydrolase n=1 Tax=Dyadobacter luteus TaxID=2259619 RepID=UPI001E5DD4F4|nr:MBL fold metallo-hydrolase [Dyadobacter luteus]
MDRRKFLVRATAALPISLGVKSLYQSTNLTQDVLNIKQFKDAALAHFSYAISAGSKLVLIDPGRDPQPYYDYADKNGLQITGVIETHPHADFISSHHEINKTKKATIYASKLTKASYPHQQFDQGDVIELGKDVKLKALQTPGHSPDSISILLEEKGRNIAVFTGDSLLFGDVGRPDLRSYSGEFATEKKNLAKQMYHTIHDQFAKLENDVKVYPAHGAGSLCGKAIRNVNESTIGYEKENNYAFGKMTEEAFVNILLGDQPVIPYYFPFDVENNKKGSAAYQPAIAAVPGEKANFTPSTNERIIDTRKAELFRKSHQTGAVNIPDGGKFETWLGSVQKPEQSFFLVASSKQELQDVIAKSAKIGYESIIKGAYVYDNNDGSKSDEFNITTFKADPGKYTIIDVRTQKESAGQPVFPGSINIPINELADQVEKLPKDKPFVIHCASGYRSAIGASIIKKQLPDKTVYDLSDSIQSFIK